MQPYNNLHHNNFMIMLRCRKINTHYHKNGGGSMQPQIHTFTLAYPISSYEHYLLKKQFFKMAEGLPKCCYENSGRTIFNYWASSGVVLSMEMFSGEYNGGMIYFKINPSTLIGDYSPRALYAPVEDVSIISDKLKKILSVIPINICVDALSLSRIDICIDCEVDKQKVLDTYVKILKKGTRSSSWEPKYFDDECDNAHSFRRSSKRYQLTVYDKMYEISRRKNPECDGKYKILRIEAALMSKGIYHMSCKYSLCGNTWEETICEIFKAGADILCDVINKIIPPGNYYSMSEARDLIMNSGYSQNKKEALFEFLKEINRKSEVNLFEIRKVKNGKKRLLQLSALGVNPVAITARERMKFLPGLDTLVKAMCSMP